MRWSLKLYQKIGIKNWTLQGFFFGIDISIFIIAITPKGFSFESLSLNDEFCVKLRSTHLLLLAQLFEKLFINLIEHQTEGFLLNIAQHVNSFVAACWKFVWLKVNNDFSLRHPATKLEEQKSIIIGLPYLPSLHTWVTSKLEKKNWWNNQNDNTG